MELASLEKITRGVSGDWVEMKINVNIKFEIHVDLEVGNFLDLWPPHGSAPLQSLVCCHFNILTSTSKDSRGSLWVHVLHFGISRVGVERSHERWRLLHHLNWKSTQVVTHLSL